MLDHSLGGGLSDPVFQAQAAFRAIMDAMARPGSVQTLDDAELIPPAPLSRGVALVALTLCDHDTPVWLDATLLDGPDVAEWLTFHTGAPIVAEPTKAAFALVSDSGSLPDFAGFAQGTPEYPDRSITLIVPLAALDGGTPLVLTGPGIDGARTFSPLGLPADFAERWARNRALFPRGIDLILSAPGQVGALPRSTRLDLRMAS
jgi:alpha-D-ribose 1-methylphosphonate 5-triphosphate synthase subunit PhnH